MLSSAHSDSPRRGQLRDHSDFPLMLLIPAAHLRRFDSSDMQTRIKAEAHLDRLKLEEMPGNSGAGVLHFYSHSMREKGKALGVVLEELERLGELREVSTFVPEDMVSPLIGSKGRQIAALQDFTRANFRFERKVEDMQDRQVRVSGSLRDIKNAIETLYSKVVDKRAEVPDNIFAKFAIPQPSASHLIGKGGQFTKSLYQHYGVELKVSRDDSCDDRRELVAILIGQHKDCLDALNEVVAKLTDAEFNSDYQRTGNEKTVMLMRIRRSESGIHSLVREVKREAQVSLKVFEGYRDEFRVEIAGDLKERQRAIRVLLEEVQSRESPKQRTRSRSRSQSPQTTILNVLVPKSLVGRLIGKGGENVKILKNRSGCHINFQQQDLTTVHTGDGKEARTCTMTGSAEAIALAVRNVWEQIMKFEQ